MPTGKAPGNPKRWCRQVRTFHKLGLACCLLSAGMRTSSANESAHKKTILQQLGGPYPSFDTYCANLDQKMQKAVKKGKLPPEGLPVPPFCSTALGISDTVGTRTAPPVLASPQPPFLAAHAYEYLQLQKFGYEEFYATASGLAIQTESGWFLFNLWRTSDLTPGCGGDAYKVDSITAGGTAGDVKLSVAYRVETDSPSDKGGAYSRTRFRVDCTLSAKGQPVCTRCWLAHQRWTGAYR